jgi:hypothetical protein
MKAKDDGPQPKKDQFHHAIPRFILRQFLATAAQDKPQDKSQAIRVSSNLSAVVVEHLSFFTSAPTANKGYPLKGYLTKKDAIDAR